MNHTLTLPPGFPPPVSEVWIPGPVPPKDYQQFVDVCEGMARFTDGFDLTYWLTPVPYAPGDVIGIREEYNWRWVYQSNRGGDFEITIEYRDGIKKFTVDQDSIRGAWQLGAWQPADTMPDFAIRYRYTVQHFEPRQVATITDGEGIGVGFRGEWSDPAVGPWSVRPSEQFHNAWHSANLGKWAWRLKVEPIGEQS